MMDPKMDEKALKLSTLMDLIKEMKSMDNSSEMPGKPKITAIEINASKKMPEDSMDPMASTMPEEAPSHEAMETPEMESEEDQGDLLSKLPPALQQLIKQHLSKKV